MCVFVCQCLTGWVWLRVNEQISERASVCGWASERPRQRSQEWASDSLLLIQCVASRCYCKCYCSVCSQSCAVPGATVCSQLSASLYAAVIVVHLPPAPHEMLRLLSGLCEIFATDDRAGGAAAEAGPLFHYLTPAAVMGGFMQPSWHRQREFASFLPCSICEAVWCSAKVPNCVLVVPGVSSFSLLSLPSGWKWNTPPPPSWLLHSKVYQALDFSTSHCLVLTVCVSAERFQPFLQLSDCTASLLSADCTHNSPMNVDFTV